ncbi:MAG TPA: TM0106 family RecB-like putative nuclease [Petrotogaceae bacterium]|nr:TM0106 family RecB-like putative nuclease [Petrotogaceae bacterium]
MDILYYESLENCPFFTPSYTRPGSYFTINIEGVEFEANYEYYKEGTVCIIRAGKSVRISHWIHAYLVYRYFEEKGNRVNDVLVELENRKFTIKRIELMNKENWIKKALARLNTRPKSAGAHCKFCTIKTACHRELLSQGDLNVVPAMTEGLIEYFKNIETDPLEVVKSNQIEKFNPSCQKALYNLKSIVEDKIIKINDIVLPEKYIIFDVETYAERDFLFGYLLEDRYIPYVFNSADSKKTEEMIDFLYNLRLPLVHYDVHDVQSLENIGRNYPALRTKISRILENSLDVFEVIIKNVSFPVTSYSLKDISKYLGFKWRTNLNGHAVIIEYNMMLKGNKEILQKILSYNEDDCRATKVLMEKLREL